MVNLIYYFHFKRFSTTIRYEKRKKNQNKIECDSIDRSVIENKLLHSFHSYKRKNNENKTKWIKCRFSIEKYTNMNDYFIQPSFHFIISHL